MTASVDEKWDRTAIELVGEAGAHIADARPAGTVACIRRRVYEALSVEVGVSIFKGPEHVIREGVINPGPDGPT